MLELTFGEQVKIILSRKGMTIKELAEKIEKQTGKKMSRQNLTQRLGRDNFQEQDMRMIAKILECPFYLDILEEHEDRTEKPVKEQKAAEPEQKEAPTRAEERDITIGELVDIHKELDAIEKKKSKKKAKKVVEENPEYVQETIFDFFVNEKAEEPEYAEEPVYEPEPEEEQVEESAIEIEEEPEYAEEPVYEPEPEEEQVEESAIEIEEEPVYEEEPEYAEEPVYEEEPEYAEEPAYEEAEPEYAEEPAYEEAEPEYEEEPVYEEAEPEYEEEPEVEAEPEYEEEPVTEPEVEEPEPKKTETEKKAHGWRAFFGIHKKHEEPVKEEKEEEKPEIQYHEFDYSEDGESGELAEEFLPDEPEEAETYAAETETAAYENAEQLNTNYDAGYQNRYAQENEEDLFTSTEEDLEKGELNPYTGHEYESNSVRMHPNRIGYVQVYDRGTHQWTDMTEWAFLGYQERKKALLGKDYEPPIYLD